MSAVEQSSHLADLIERLEGAADSLFGLQHGRDVSERVRLAAKREGVLLALSYAREEYRLLATEPVAVKS